MYLWRHFISFTLVLTVRYRKSSAILHLLRSMRWSRKSFKLCFYCFTRFVKLWLKKCSSSWTKFFICFSIIHDQFTTIRSEPCSWVWSAYSAHKTEQCEFWWHITYMLTANTMSRSKHRNMQPEIALFCRNPYCSQGQVQKAFATEAAFSHASAMHNILLVTTFSAQFTPTFKRRRIAYTTSDA